MRLESETSESSERERCEGGWRVLQKTVSRTGSVDGVNPDIRVVYKRVQRRACLLVGRIR